MSFLTKFQKLHELWWGKFFFLTLLKFMFSCYKCNCSSLLIAGILKFVKKNFCHNPKLSVLCVPQMIDFTI